MGLWFYSQNKKNHAIVFPSKKISFGFSLILQLIINNGSTAEPPNLGRMWCDKRKTLGNKIHKCNDLKWPYTAWSIHIAPICFPIHWLSDLIFIQIKRQVTSCKVLKKILWSVCEFSFRIANDRPAVTLAGDKKKGMLGKTKRAFPFVSCSGFNSIPLLTRT